MKPLPTSEQMTHELVAGGWRQKRIGLWISPGGALYLGPYQAWRAMNGILLREGIFGDASGAV